MFNRVVFFEDHLYVVDTQCVYLPLGVIYQSRQSVL